MARGLVDHAGGATVLRCRTAIAVHFTRVTEAPGVELNDCHAIACGDNFGRLCESLAGHEATAGCEQLCVEFQAVARHNGRASWRILQPAAALGQPTGRGLILSLTAAC